MKRWPLMLLLVAGTALAQVAQSPPQWRPYGPFKGFVASVPRHLAPIGAITGESFNYLYDPVEQKLIRRGGTSTMDSILTEDSGLNWRARQTSQVTIPQQAFPVPATLLGRDSSGTTFYGRLVVDSSSLGLAKHYELGTDFSSTTYPTGTVDGIGCEFMPLYANAVEFRPSGSAGRGYLGAGSRNFKEAGNWIFLPNAGGTPVMWDKAYNVAAGSTQQVNRIRPWGQYTPMYPPDFPLASYPSGSATAKAWREGDRFYCSVIFQFEDGSYSQPVLPNLAIAGTGLGGNSGLVTVKAGSGSTFYDFIPWRHIPVGPYGTVARLLLRTPKISGSTPTGGNPGFRDLRITAVINDNIRTSYDDPNGDDNALVVNPEVVRFDQMWPKPARYVFSNDARIVECGSIKPSPAAILLCPTGVVSSRDLNGDANGVGYTDVSNLALGNPLQSGSAFGVKVKTDSLILYYTRAGKLLDKQFAFATYTTIRDLVDAINATSATTDSCHEWAAQIVPGADDRQASTSLFTTTSTDFGDNARFGGKTGIMFVRSPSWPGVLYWGNTYLTSFPTDDISIYFTGASPGHPQSTPLNFYVGNRRAPPSRAVGRCQGGAPLKTQFVICYENAIYALKNFKGGGTGLDDDYRLVPINETRGCVSWSSIAYGDGWVGYMTRDGYVATDGEQEALISGDVFSRPKQTGEWVNEMQKTIASIGADGDQSYFYAQVMGGQLNISYRKSASATFSDRRLVYDYSAGQAASGLSEILDQGKPYGWSSPLTNNCGPMAECLIDGNGPYKIASNEAKTTGRWDKIESGTQDGSTNITAKAYCTTDFAGVYNLKAAEQMLAVYKNVGGGLSATFTRSPDRGTVYSLPLGTSGGTDIYTRTVVDLNLGARLGADVFELVFSDTGAGAKSEIWTAAIKYRVLDSVR